VIDPTQHFAELVARPVADVPLDEAMFAIAAHQNKDLDVLQQLARLDALAGRYQGDSVGDLAQHLFVHEGFRGNHEDYYDPANSFLDRVLDRKLGLPISLSILAMEVGRRVGVPLLGIGMPGHFLVRSANDPTLFVDAFDGGVLLDRGGCLAQFRRVVGGGGQWDDSLLAPVGTIDILTRVLTNLHAAFSDRRDAAAMAWVGTLVAALPAGTAALRRTARWN
jgi:regulator of sirC expression with transglutaminase-like and TPR domain